MFKKIIVAVDTSETSKEVFAQAIELAKLTQGKLMLLHVLSPEEENSPLPIPPNMTELYPAAGNELTLETWHEQWKIFERQSLEMLQNYGKEAKQQGIEVEYRQISGNPGKQICKFAQQWQADIILIGHRGLTGLTEMLLGSVSNYVIHRAPCSVLTVQNKK